MNNAERINIKGENSNSTIYLNTSFTLIDQVIKNRNTVIITDTNVFDLYNSNFPNFPVIKIEPGENNKTLETVNLIFEELLNHKIDRHSLIIGIGGGIVCDITGFVASTYMRGIEFGFVPTTLLSQVDASIGGKNGVNFQGYKNLVGTFNQPEFVVIDYSFLSTLPEREILCGLGEILKHGLIKNRELFEYLSQNSEDIVSLKTEAIHKVVSESLEIKSEFVMEDEKEKGVRKILNFGHTVAHGIEKISPEYSHGEAVALGILAASYASMRQRMLNDEDFLMIMDTLKKLNLPNSYNFENPLLLKAIDKDKKRQDNKIEYILLKGIGKPVIKKLTIRDIKGNLNAMR